MTVSALDTSVVIAALLSWHEFHEPALAAVIAAFSVRGGRTIVPAPVLVEAYSVMTRLPPPHRISPATAGRLLTGSFEDKTDVVSLSGTETWKFLDDAAAGGMAGGRLYDALIVRCALKGGATRLLTLDRRDFERIDLGGIALIVPGER